MCNLISLSHCILLDYDGSVVWDVNITFLINGCVYLNLKPRLRGSRSSS